MDIIDFTNEQLRLIIYGLGFVAFCFFCVFIWSLLVQIRKFSRASIKTETPSPNWAENPQFAVHTSSHPILKGDIMTNAKKGPKKGLLKSNAYASIDGAKWSDEIRQNKIDPSTLADENTYELLRVLVDLSTEELIVEVEGQQYRRINQVKERAIGQRIFEVVASLLQFTEGIIATKTGLKQLPKPQAALTNLPSRTKAVARSLTDQPESTSPSLKSSRLGQRLQQRQTSATEPHQPSLKPAPSGPVPFTSQTNPIMPTSMPPRIGYQSSSEAKPKFFEFKTGKKSNANTPDLEPKFDLAAEIDYFVQQRLFSTGNPTPIKISSGPSGQVIINVAGRVYPSVEDVEDDVVRDLIQQAISDWSNR